MNEIDKLMDEDPLNLSSREIDQIIDYNRKLLAGYNAGVKPAKKGEGKIEASELLEKLGMVKAIAAPKLRRI